MTPPDIALARSILFVPGHRPDRFAKALATGADAVVIDLEDAVPPGEKAAARQAVLARPAAPAGVALGVRMNPLPSPEGIADLAALIAAAAPDFLLLPKVEAAEELRIVRRAFAAAPRPPQLVALIESAEGLAHAGAIAAEPGCVALAFGGVDLAADLGCAVAWEPLLAHRAALVAAAARAGRGVVDVPFLALEDEAGLAEETRRVQALGFTAKLAIHPRQVATIQSVLTPTAEEVARARRVVAAMEDAAGGVCVVDGKMVDLPVLRAARRVLARAH
ncbi:MAG TPA: aldolase/citrate lyase family protein [Falsiroseomonas sp.]|jgi:citrate lyase beta subunit|nr:aldolase/citrate lyase family protein [Falsiroseomonas sp.]